MNYKVAIVGAGPSGYFTAQALQNAQSDDISFSIDMIERLPTPWGLVRSGVAPDHQKIKGVSKVFEKIAKNDRFRLFANVELGKDISLKDLREAYDAVVLATGASVGKKLEIKGEELPNCISAGDLVPWYNGHPDFVDLKVDTDTDTVVIIGSGNVALDVARMFAINPTELEHTDIAQQALSVFKSSKIKNVIICGRRGPEHAAFTTSELRELSKLNNIDVHIDKEQIYAANSRVHQRGEIERETRNNLEIMELIAEQNKKGFDKKIIFKFLVTPIGIKGKENVEEIIFQINKVNSEKVSVTEETFSIKAGLAVTAIGYGVDAYSGLKVEDGRIANIAGHVEHNVYVTGWAKRGPVGVIGTNKSDSADVVDLILLNLNEPKKSIGIEKLLKSGHQIVSQIGWEKINATEIISGEMLGKPRLKITDWNHLKSLGVSG
jgi:ferredoxin--NADP+ reductase